jgi:GAF domain-containing protein
MGKHYDHPLPKNEEARLDALHKYDIFDSLPEKSYENIAKLAAHICGVDKAIISFLNETSKWHKANYNIDTIEVPRGFAIFSRTILNIEPLVINDTLDNPETSSIGIVCNPPYVRFYAGVPLLTADNIALGTLCVVDSRPNALSAKQIDLLMMLGNQLLV